MTNIVAPLANIATISKVVDIVRSCILNLPEPPPPEGEETIFVPVAPGINKDKLPPPPTIIDTSPDEIIGCIETTANNPQVRLNALFPSASEGDGVIERSTNDIWVYRGTTWDNVGPNPGPTILINETIPFWNETVLLTGRTKTNATVISLAYALQLLTNIETTIKTAITATKTTVVSPIFASVATSSKIPLIASGASVGTPSSIGLLAAPEPTITGGASVLADKGEISVIQRPGITIGRQKTSIFPEAANIGCNAALPAIINSVFINVPPINIETSVYIPSFLELDSYFNSVSLLLHMDGNEGGTKFIDSSLLARTITSSGSVQIVTTPSKFSQAAWFSGGYLSASAVGPVIGTSDFTAEAWIRPSLLSGYRTIIALNTNNSYEYNIYISSGVAIIWIDDGERCSSSAILADTWYHIAVTRTNGVVRLFVNGVKSISDYTNGDSIPTQATRIGANGRNTPSEIFQGYIDDVRVTPGISRYQSNFTPPTAPFTELSETLPPVTITVTPKLHAISTSSPVLISATVVTASALAPVVIIAQDTEVLPPNSTVILAAITPAVVSGVSAEAPTVVITLSGMVPTIATAVSEDYYGSWVQQNYIWYPESYPPWWG
jgi:hypothetical protein